MFGWILFTGAVIALLSYTAAATQRLLRSRRQLPASKPTDVGLAYEAIRFAAREQLEMRWYLTPDGLCCRWVFPSLVARDEAAKVADDYAVQQNTECSLILR